MARNRRDVLAAVGGVGLTAVAGCLDEPATDDERAGTVHASFYTLSEFTEAVVGDDRPVENAVPDGEHGHGWEPSTSLVPEIAAGEAFVYLDADGFQGWVDDAVPELESERGEDLALINALAGIDLLEYDDHGHEHDRVEELPVGEVTLLEDGDTVAYAHGGHWHRDPLSLPLEDDRTLTAIVEHDADDELRLGDEYALGVRAGGDGDEVLESDVDGESVTLRGVANGFTELTFEVRADGDVVYETPALKTEVGEHAHDRGDHGHGHSHGEYDAKFFSDPVLARRGVENVRDGLSTLDPDAGAAYEANAAAYIRGTRRTPRGVRTAPLGARPRHRRAGRPRFLSVPRRTLRLRDPHAGRPLA